MILLSRSEEIVLIAVWKLKDNAYGVTVRDLISSATGRDWSFGAVYKPLKKLVHRGFLDARFSSPVMERGGRRKVMYALSDDGREALREIGRIHRSLWTEDCLAAFQ
jgi:DNA-binding PadR family transcriptional regulator